jgi:hypothetical protein
MKKLLFAAAAVILLVAAPQAQAQTTAAVTLHVVVPQVLRIGVDAAQVDFTFVEADYDFGTGAASKTGTTTVTHMGNIAHDVTIEADAPNFTASGGATYVKPASDVSWSSSSLTGVTLSQTPTDISSSAFGQGRAQETVTYTVSANTANEDPGNYDLALTYTVTP